MTFASQTPIALFAQDSASDSSAKTLRFDYVIVGGGTCGLVLANRLSEDPKVTIVVIEAGDSVFDDPNVTDTMGYGRSLGSAIDWQYTSTPQVYGGNKTLAYSQGKALGGTSTINGMTYIRPEDVQIDLWEQLGNKGWNWVSLFENSKLSEQFVPPTPAQSALGVAYDPSYHGCDGHVGVGWPSTFVQGDAYPVLNDTWQNLSIPSVPDVNGGKLRGCSICPFTQKDNIRQDSARAYYWPIAARRPNLRVFVNTTATRIQWATKDAASGLLSSEGVEAIGLDGTKSIIAASREVILSAGTIRSPLLLEHSGVGNPRILQQFSIPSVIDLPSVGENLQDQPSNVVSATANRSWVGYPPCVTFLNAQDLFGVNTSSVEANIRKNVPNYAALIAQNSNGAFESSVQERLLSTQADLIFQHAIPLVEVLNASSPGLVVLPFWNLLPFARGSVHVNSDDPTKPPTINPNIFEFDFDMQVQVYGARMTRRVLRTPPLSGLVELEVSPGSSTVPNEADDAALEGWIKSSYSANHHSVGTCAMLPRNLGGVVDAELKVYGTRNVRVVDASVLPFQVCGHLTSALYGVAEKAATIIKQA